MMVVIFRVLLKEECTSIFERKDCAMELLYQGIAAVVMWVAIACKKEKQKNPVTKTVLNVIITISLVAFFYLVIRFWDLYAIAKILTLGGMTLAIFFIKCGIEDQDDDFCGVAIVAICVCLFPAFIALMIGGKAYGNNIKVSEDVSEVVVKYEIDYFNRQYLVYKNNISVDTSYIADEFGTVRKNHRIDERYSVLHTTGENESEEIVIPIELTTICYDVKEGEEYYLSEVHETRQKINYNVNPPEPWWDETVKSIRYELHIPRYSIGQ
jgi:hypothetical protein